MKYKTFLNLLLTFAIGTEVWASPSKKMVMLGFDGMDPKLLQQFMQEGKMPNFERVIANGGENAAGIGTGVWGSTEEVGARLRASADARFEPGEADPAGHRRWRVAVERSKGWARLR